MNTHDIDSSFNGFLFIGDPHASSQAPGRRIDDYKASVLSKLAEAAEVSNKFNLVPVILGDLIHRDRENSIELACDLIDVFRQFKVTPLDLEGNHGKLLTTVGQTDMEELLDKTGAIRLVRDSGLIGAYSVAEHRVELYGVPYGQPIPMSLTQLGADLAVPAFRILITHHDLAFEGAYPGAAMLTEIEGCNLTVNGHMHKTAPNVVVGQTTHCCPGNIEPLSVDMIDHKPAVWEWNPREEATLHPHYLKHERDVFDLTGIQVMATDADDAVAALVLEHSEFAEELAAMATDDAARTSDGSVFLDDVAAVLEASGADSALRALVGLTLKKMEETATP